MSSDQWQHAKEALSEAMSLAGDERVVFLADLQRSSPELHDEVVSLLESQEEAEQQGFLDGVAGAGAIEAESGDNETRAYVPESSDDETNVAAANPEETMDQYRTGTFDPDRTRDYVTTDDLKLPTNAPSGKSDLVGPDYELDKKIGQGGMGVVYKAYHRSLRRTVALKIITGGGLRDEIDIARFHIEAEAAARLDHPGIIPVYDVGEYNGNHYYAMAYVEGPSLSDFVGPKAKKLAPRRTAEIMEQVCRAVQFAHDRAVIHRDLKPANVMLENGEVPRLADFGLAKNMGEDDGLTMTGQVMGTPSYMAPEQATGKLEEISNRTDVYSLGATLYALLAGRPPFAGGTMLETIRQVVRADPEPLTQILHTIPQDLQTICEKCLAKKPQDRYASAAAVADDLQLFLERKPISARPLGFWARGWRLCQRHPVESSLLAVTLAAIIVGSIVSVNYGIQANRALAKANAHAQELREAVKETFVFASEDVLAQEPGMQAARAKLLESAQRYYSNLLQQSPGDTESQREMADAQFMLAKVQMALEQDDKALETLEAALQMQQALANELTEDAVLLSAKAKTHNQLARLSQKNWQILTQSVDGEVALTGKQAALADAQLASWKMHSSEVIALRQQVVVLDANNLEYKRLLASALMNEGNALSIRGFTNKNLIQHDEARQILLNSQEVRLAVLKEFPDERRMRRDLGQAYFNMANNELTAADLEREDNAYYGRLQRSVDDLTLAIMAYKQLPSDQLELRSLLELARCYGLRADSYFRLSGKENVNQVVEDYDQAKKRLRQLTDRNPKVFRYRIALAENQYNLCAFWCFCEEYEEAIKHLVDSRETLLQGLRVDPQNLGAAEQLTSFSISIVDHLVKKQAVELAQGLAQDALEELQNLQQESLEYEWLGTLVERLKAKADEVKRLRTENDDSNAVT